VEVQNIVLADNVLQLLKNGCSKTGLPAPSQLFLSSTKQKAAQRQSQKQQKLAFGMQLMDALKSPKQERNIELCRLQAVYMQALEEDTKLILRAKISKKTWTRWLSELTGAKDAETQLFLMHARGKEVTTEHVQIVVTKFQAEGLDTTAFLGIIQEEFQHLTL
jgi:hypothetical protein